VPIERKEKHVYSQLARLLVSVVVLAFVNAAAVRAEEAPAAVPEAEQSSEPEEPTGEHR